MSLASHPDNWVAPRLTVAVRLRNGTSHDLRLRSADSFSRPGLALSHTSIGAAALAVSSH